MRGDSAQASLASHRLDRSLLRAHLARGDWHTPARAQTCLRNRTTSRCLVWRAQEERAEKLRVVGVYNARLTQRERRRDFLRDRGLLNLRRMQVGGPDPCTAARQPACGGRSWSLLVALRRISLCMVSGQPVWMLLSLEQVDCMGFQMILISFFPVCQRYTVSRLQAPHPTSVGPHVSL